jgi:hypothetical protein
MPEMNDHQFHHRPNRDGTHDSICSACYMTVASTPEELELVSHERAHICDPVQLYQVSQCGHYPSHNHEPGTLGPSGFAPRPRTA